MPPKALSGLEVAGSRASNPPAVASQEAPLVIVTGGDALIEDVCRDLRDAGYRATFLGRHNPGLRERIERTGARFVEGSPRSQHALSEAGIHEARALLALDHDDRINLEAVLQAREANPLVRIVMRQFNRRLARKIERNLPDCSVISLAAHSAATYAAAAVERSAFLGVEFPSGSRSLVAFVQQGSAESPTPAGARVLWRDERASVAFGPLEAFAQAAPPLRRSHGTFESLIPRIAAIVSEFDPLLRILVITGICVFIAATIFFSIALRLHPVTAAYFVTSTMTTVGYGDIALADKSRLLQLTDIVLMSLGVIISNLAIAFVAAALVRAQWNAVQGLRPIRDKGHIVVFGAGRVGTRVVDYLCDLGALITVVELKPTPELLRRARTREISLLTGDGTLDDTLDLCNLGEARSTVVVTDSDANNLEIGFGARARHGDIPVIMRIAEPPFAAAIRKHFEIRRAFSAAALASSVFSDLVATPSARGRVAFGGRAFRVTEHVSASSAQRDGTVVAAARPGESPRAVRGWEDVNDDDAVLVLSEP